MKEFNTSMEKIEKSEHTMAIGNECGIGLIKEQDAPVQTKVCPRCGKTLPITEYYTNKRNKDGLQDRCKSCQAEVNREYYLKKKAERKSPEDTVEKEVVMISSQEKTVCKVYSEPELAKFTPRQLMQELKARGFTWEYMLEPQRKVYYNKI